MKRRDSWMSSASVTSATPDPCIISPCRLSYTLNRRDNKMEPWGTLQETSWGDDKCLPIIVALAANNLPDHIDILPTSHGQLYKRPLKELLGSIGYSFPYQAPHCTEWKPDQKRSRNSTVPGVVRWYHVQWPTPKKGRLETRRWLAGKPASRDNYFE